ncbi:globoside alpha-1,3-N-acetylgalactosaminyltransferase 1-like [Sinocyclocheilus rhinocerous]|nr:PREDICTED: globoside alpha-1,3-N-acetylgalactosaminyltransferase 1-like [Sinocyclocheilus rhinocerous]
MRFRQIFHFFLLGMFVGLSLSGLIYWGFTSIWYGNHLTGNLGRTDVASVTPWLAPIVWEGTFDSTVIDSIYKQQNITIATTVFALGK